MVITVESTIKGFTVRVPGYVTLYKDTYLSTYSAAINAVVELIDTIMRDKEGTPIKIKYI